MQLNTARCDLTDLSRLTRAQRQETHHQSLITNGELYLGNIFSCLKIYASYCLVCEQPESLLQLSHNLLRLRPRAVIFNTARIMRQGSRSQKIIKTKHSDAVVSYESAKTVQIDYSLHNGEDLSTPECTRFSSKNCPPGRGETESWPCHLLVSWSWCHLLVTTPRTDHLTPHTWHGNNISSFTLPQFPHMLHIVYEVQFTLFLPNIT